MRRQPVEDYPPVRQSQGTILPASVLQRLSRARWRSWYGASSLPCPEGKRAQPEFRLHSSICRKMAFFPGGGVTRQKSGRSRITAKLNFALRLAARKKQLFANGKFMRAEPKSVISALPPTARLSVRGMICGCFNPGRFRNVARSALTINKRGEKGFDLSDKFLFPLRRHGAQSDIDSACG